MRYIGWKKREVSVMDFNVGRTTIQITDLYIFDDPKLVNHKTGFMGVRPKKFNDYEYWHMNKGLKRKESAFSSGIGIHKDCFLELDEKINLTELSKTLGIKEQLLQSIL